MTDVFKYVTGAFVVASGVLVAITAERMYSNHRLSAIPLKEGGK